VELELCLAPSVVGNGQRARRHRLLHVEYGQQIVGDESIQRSAELMCRPGAVKCQTVAVNQLP